MKGAVTGRRRPASREAEDRGRFGVFLEGVRMPATGEPTAGGSRLGWVRQLHFRFEISVAAGGLAWESRQLVDIRVDPVREQARVTGSGPEIGVPGKTASLEGAGWPVVPPPRWLAWVPEYELARLGALALARAREVAKRELSRFRQQMRAVYLAEARRLDAYFERRRQEAVAGALASLHRAEGVAAFALFCGHARDDPRPHGRVQTLEKALGKLHLLRQALLAIEAERRQCLAELRARMRPVARLSVAGVAVVWRLCPEGHGDEAGEETGREREAFPGWPEGRARLRGPDPGSAAASRPGAHLRGSGATP